MSPKGSTTLTGSYKDKPTRRVLFLVDEGKRVVTDEESEYHREFNVTVTDGQPYVFEYDDESIEDLAVIDFFKNHPLCLSDGHQNPNLAVGKFRVRLEHERIELEISKLEKNLEIALKVLSMSFEDKYDLAFALGINPKGMTHSDLIVRLLGSNLLGVAVEDSKTFDIFYNSMDSNKKALVYANKAVALGIVSSEGGYYKVGGRTIGTTIKDVVDTCLSDKEFFLGFIVPEVDKKYTTPAEKQDDYKQVPEIVATEIEARSEELAPDPNAVLVEKKPAPRGRRK